MAIHKVNGCYVISSHDCWRPGSYDTEQTARYAFRFDDLVLIELQEKVNQNPDFDKRVITFEMLQAAKSPPPQPFE